MATQTLIQLKYSTANSVPLTLQQSEPAYSFVSDKLFIGDGSGVVAIGGEFYTALLDANTASASPNTLAMRNAYGSIYFNDVTANTINSNTTMYAGLQDALPLPGATNPVIGAGGNANSYLQSYVRNINSGELASADMVAYPDNGSDVSGWVDMGITSSTYADPNYAVMKPNEGYIQMSAPSGSGTSGNLVFATDSTGTYNDIVFSTGGFTGVHPPIAHFRSGQGLVIDATTESFGNSTGALVVMGGASIGDSLQALTLWDANNRVLTSSTQTSGPGISISSATTTGPAAAATINNTGVISLTANTTDVTAHASTGNIVFGLADTAVSPGTYGGAGQIPTIIVDSKGRLTFAGNNTVATSFNIAGNTGTPDVVNTGETLTVIGDTTGITTEITDNKITISTDNTVLRSNTSSVGSQTISSDLTITGNLTLIQTNIQSFNIASSTVTTGDSLLKLAANNTIADTLDIGFYGQSYTGAGLGYHGLIREGSTGVNPGTFYLFKDLATDPTANVVNYVGLNTADLHVGNVISTSTYSTSGSVSTGQYTGTYSDGIVLDYDSGLGVGRISVGSTDGIALHNNFGPANNTLLAINGAGEITTGNWTATAITVEYGGTGRTAVSNNNLLYGSTTDVLNVVAEGTASQTLIVDTTGAPVWGALNVSSSYAVTGVLPATHGGTDQSSYTVGDILYASGTTALSKLIAGAANYSLVSNGAGVAPTYQQVSLTSGVSGTLPVTSGGTNSSSFNVNGVVISGATSTSALTSVTGSAYQVLQLNASGIPVFSGLNGGTF